MASPKLQSTTSAAPLLDSPVVKEEESLLVACLSGVPGRDVNWMRNLIVPHKPVANNEGEGAVKKGARREGKGMGKAA